MDTASGQQDTVERRLAQLMNVDKDNVITINTTTKHSDTSSDTGFIHHCSTPYTHTQILLSSFRILLLL